MESISGEYLAEALDKLSAPAATHALHSLQANRADSYDVVLSRSPVLASNLRAKYLTASGGLEIVEGLEQMLTALAGVSGPDEMVRGLVLGVEYGVSFTVVLNAERPVALGVLRVVPKSGT